MTIPKAAHREAQGLIVQHLKLRPVEAGLVGDTKHAEGGDSYHLGADKTRDRKFGRRYSVDESSRDQRGLDEHSSALDLGFFVVTTPRGTFDLYDYNAWLVGLCRAGDPDTRDLREVIYSPDGRTVERWDALGHRDYGDGSHRTHTHHSEFRDADGHRMVNLVRRWLAQIGLLPLEDDMPTAAEVAKAIMTYPIESPKGSQAKTWTLADFLANTYGATISARTYSAEGRSSAATAVELARALSTVVTTDVAADSARALEVRQHLEQLVTATAGMPGATAAAVLDRIADPDASLQAVADGLRTILGARAGAVGQLLTGVQA